MKKYLVIFMAIAFVGCATLQTKPTEQTIGTTKAEYLAIAKKYEGHPCKFLIMGKELLIMIFPMNAKQGDKPIACDVRTADGKTALRFYETRNGKATLVWQGRVTEETEL